MATPTPMSTPLEWLTLALVIITFFYALQTRATVKEMQNARGDQVMPKLVPAFEVLGPLAMFPRIANIGPGSATDIECTFRLEPGGPEWRWRWALLGPGESQSFHPTGNNPDGTAFSPYMEQLKAHYTHLSLDASYRDAMGRHHKPGPIKAEIRGTLEQIEGMFAPAEPPLKKIEKHLSKAADDLHALRRAAEGMRTPPSD